MTDSLRAVSVEGELKHVLSAYYWKCIKLSSVRDITMSKNKVHSLFSEINLVKQMPSKFE